MNRELYIQLKDFEELINKSLKQVDEQVGQFNESWNTLTNNYEGDGAEETEEMHLLVVAKLNSYLEQLQQLGKLVSDELD